MVSARRSGLSSLVMVRFLVVGFADGMRPVKVATYNINGIRSRLPRLLDWLAREGPDIVCLQELKATDAAFPVDAIRSAGYGALWIGQTAWNGVAMTATEARPVASPRAL